MNRIRLITVILTAVLISVVGCSSSKSGKKAELYDGSSGSLGETDLNAQREGRFGEGSIPIAEGEGIFRDIRFDFDSSAITDLARQDIEYNAQVLRENPGVSLQLEGHCDERGTAEYNMALGAERARAVYDVLISYGIRPDRMNTISYGEEVPLNMASNEAAWSENRRVHFSPFRGS